VTNNTTTIQKYLQYSKRIALFGIIQWGIVAIVSLLLVLLSAYLDLFVDEWAARVVNNIVTCSSALAVAICSGYFAHSAYDNNLKQRVVSALESEDKVTSGSSAKKTCNG